MINREQIKYRVGTFKTNGTKSYATFLVYVDARTVMDELDLEFGMWNWQFDWEILDGHNFAVKGTLKVRRDEKQEWVTRQDVGYSQTEKMKKGINDTECLKDAVSDALKRSAVQFGIGRFLYDAPFLYTEEVNVENGRLNKYKPLTDMGKKMIEGNLDKWYKQVEKEMGVGE